MGNRLLHLGTSDLAYSATLFPGLLVLGEVISYGLLVMAVVGNITVLTSDPRYPVTLFPELFGPGRGCLHLYTSDPAHPSC